MFIDEYRSTLKHPEAEEVLDLLLYRPPGFLLAKGVYKSPLTPNQLTALSFLLGLAATYAFSIGTQPALLWGAVAYFVANVLDCADGQLARLQQSGSPFGRILDGSADYLATIGVFLGLGVGFGDWWLVAIAGVSSGVHAAVFDYYQSTFIAAMNRAGDFLQNEQQKYAVEMRRSSSNKIRASLVRIYLGYIWVQQMTLARLPSGQRGHKGMIRLWSFLGPSTNRTFLIVCAVFGKIDLFLWIVAIGGNLWLLLCFLVQYALNTRYLPTPDL